jgi:hypothetical protein
MPGFNDFLDWTTIAVPLSLVPEAEANRGGRVGCNCGLCSTIRRDAEMERRNSSPEFDAEGYDSEGYDYGGFARDGFNRAGYDSGDRDRHGFNSRGYDREGFNAAGWDRHGYGRDGFDSSGFNVDGYDREGFNYNGWDREGYNRAGFARDGFNRAGFDHDGNKRPCTCTDCRRSRGELTYDNRWYRPSSYRRGRRVRNEWGELVYPPGSNNNPQQRARDVLLNYSYTPEPLIFRRTHGEDEKKSLYLGFEVEMTSDLTLHETDLVKAHGEAGKLLYLKSDGSVAGFEMVSHPMTWKWARDNFHWELIDELIAAGASVRASENGLHVHVSRAGFKDEAHTYRWMKLWYRNANNVIELAGRSGGEWGAFHGGQREIQGKHLKTRAKLRHNGRLGREEYLERGTRYDVLNLVNDKTIEVRIFAAPESTAEFRARIELVVATVEYTRNLTTKQVKAGAWKWASFRSWLSGQAEEYPNLVAAEARFAGPELVLR